MTRCPLTAGLIVAWLAQGSAIALAQSPLTGAIIVVDPGHGGQRYSKSYTGGTRGVTSKTTESELNLKVALELAKFLREQGATVQWQLGALADEWRAAVRAETAAREAETSLLRAETAALRAQAAGLQAEVSGLQDEARALREKYGVAGQDK